MKKINALRHPTWVESLALSYIVWIGSLILSSNMCMAQSPEQDISEVYKQGLEALEEEEYSTAEGAFRRVLIENPFYQDSTGQSAWLGLGLVQERQEEPLLALQTMLAGHDSLEESGLHDGYLNYDLARLITEHGLDAHGSRITELMYDLFYGIHPQHQPDLWDRMMADMGFMLGMADQEKLQESIDEPGGNPGDVIFQFFRREDPNPITRENELFARIFQRAKNARKRYSSLSSSLGYDDRGEVFIRLGQPVKIHWNHGGLLADMGYAINPYEVWFYYQIDYDAYFTFVQVGGTGDFKKVDGPEEIFGTFYRGKRVFGEELYRQQPGRVAANLHLRIYEELAPIHTKFRERLYRLQEQISPAEAVDYARRNFVPDDREHSRWMNDAMPRVAYYTEETHEVLPVDLSIVRFLENDKKVRAEMYYSIPNEALMFDRDSRGRHTRIVGEIGLFDDRMNLVVSDSVDHFWIARSQAEWNEGVFISQWTSVLDPGTYHLYFRLENPLGKKMSVIESDITIESFPETELALSDIQLVRNVEPSDETGLFIKNGLFVTPLASNAIPIGQPFFLYFEIYRLYPEDGDEAAFEINFNLIRKKKKRGFLGLGGKVVEEQVYQENVQRRGEGPVYRRFAFDDLDEGEYKLRIHVSRLETDLEAEREIPLKIIE